MAIIKWKDNKLWTTFYYGAFQNIKAQIKNSYVAINNLAKAIRMRCRRDKNLSDIYDPAAGRTNLQLINDCSALAKAPHHHDSRYIPLIEKEERERKAEDEKLWASINGLSFTDPKPKESRPSGGGTTAPTSPATGEQLIATLNFGQMYGDSENEIIYWKYSASFNSPRSGSVRVEFSGQVAGDGQIGIKINGGEIANRWDFGSFWYMGGLKVNGTRHLNVDFHDVTHNYGNYNVHAGSNSFDIGVDGNNPTGVLVGQCQCKIFLIS